VKSKAAIGATNPQKQKTELQWRRQLSKGEKQSSNPPLQTFKNEKQNCNCNRDSAKIKNKAAIVTANRQEQKAELQLQLQISKGRNNVAIAAANR